MNRRKLLIVGSASIAILGVTGGLALHSNLKTARRPWGDADLTLDDPRIAALSFAILAPNPHNRQPWLVELVDDLNLTLYCDTERLLPQTDPFNRQIVVGLGAFLELLKMAALEKDYRLEIDLFPDGEPQPHMDQRPVAHIKFVADKNAATDPLFSYVKDRRTSRVPYDIEKPVPSSEFEKLETAMRESQAQFGYSNSGELVGKLRDICNLGWETEINTPRAHHESTQLTRIGEKEINASPDGISLSGPIFEGLKLTGIMSREAMDDPDSRMFQETLKFYSRLIDASPAFAWLISPGNSRADQIDAGRNWVRLQLAATRQGISFQPLSQVLQEFPEMSDHYASIHRMLDIEEPARIQGLFRLGYAKSLPPSPRWPLETRLISAT